MPLIRGIVITLSLSWLTRSSPVLNIDPGLSLKANPVLNFSPEISPEFKGLCIVSSECERIHRPVPGLWNSRLFGLENAISYLASRLAPPYRRLPDFYPPTPFPLLQRRPPQPIFSSEPLGGPTFGPSLQQIGLPDLENPDSDFVRQLAQNPEFLQLMRSLPAKAGGEVDEKEIASLLDDLDLQKLIGTLPVNEESSSLQNSLERLEEEPEFLEFLRILDKGLGDSSELDKSNLKKS